MMADIDPIAINSAVNEVYGRSKGSNLQGLDPDLSMRLSQAQDAYKERYGKELPITSGVRSKSEQQKLFDAKKSNPNLVAVPGTSKHETGNAIDISSSVPDSFLNEFGLHRPFGAKDRVHTQVMPNAPELTQNSATNDNSGFQIDINDINQSVSNAYKAKNQGAVPEPTVGGFLKEYGKDIGRGTAGLLDTTVGGIIPAVTGTIGYSVARVAGHSPEEAKYASEKIADVTSQPFGKAFGVTNEPAYQNEPVSQLFKNIGKSIQDVSKSISEKTGAPAQDIENIINIGLLGAPELAKTAPVKAITRPIAEEAKMIGGAIKQAAKPIISKVQDKLSKGVSAEQAQAQFEAKGGKSTEAIPESQEKLGTAKPVPEDSPYSEIKYSKNDLPYEEQQARAQTLAKVLGSDHAADMMAVSGNGKARATNYQLSKTDTPQGNFLKERFDEEARRLNDFAEKRIEDTGGTAGLDESSVYKRGHTILDPLKGLDDYFNEKTRQIYAQRDAIAKDIPVLAENIKNVLNDESLTLMNTDSIGLANAAKARLQKLGMMDKEGNLLPTNAEKAENFRKFVNENWDPKNRNLHKNLKEAVDQDVLANIDQSTPLYQDARALYALRKNTLDNPKGISNILEAEGPNGINRKVDIEKIAPNIINMPVEQFTHVINTLKNMPPELQPRADRAIGEIKAQFANNVAELVNKSAKNPNALTKYLNGNKEVMSRVFSPEEMQNFRDLHNAAQILKTDTGYPGAAAQKINIDQKLMGKIGSYALGKAAATAGNAIAGPVGAIVADQALGKLSARRAAKLAQKAENESMKKAQSSFVPLSELLQEKK